LLSEGEGMKTPNDISVAEEKFFKQNPDMLREISVQVVTSGGEKYFAYAHNGEPQWSVDMPILEGLPAGYVAINNAEEGNVGFCLGGWKIKASEVLGGWGPLLYDVAMEWATKNGGGLLSDRNLVSKEAFAVWNYYDKHRSDIETAQLDIVSGQNFKQLTPDDPKDDCSQYSSIKWTDYEGGEWYDQPTSRIYRSKGTPTMDKLQALGKLEEV